MVDDLELKDLEQYYGTTQYHKGWLNVNLTDGVAYVSENGYSWFVTDAISVIKTKGQLKNESFLAVKLAIDKNSETAVMTIDDGNNNVLYKQEYGYTNCKRDLTLFFIDNVLMLDREY
jgi:hypothetical protein